MKLSLPVVLPLATMIPAAESFSASSRSFGSTFTGRRYSSSLAMMSRRRSHVQRGKMLMYDSSNDPPSSNSNSDSSSNMWTALASTERWISETLSSSARVGPEGKVENPYTRKEVSYVCETSEEGAMIVAGIFRRLREAREVGETHGATQEDRLLEQGESYSPNTMRQTQVVVIPGSPDLKSFAVFDNLIRVINQARRNARDYVTDHHSLDDEQEQQRDWVVSINCAHLHPKFGEKSPKQVLEEMKQEEEQGEVDLNLKAYKERREAARRSPYPTVVIEVMATPPPDFGSHPPPPPSAASVEDDKVTSEDIQRLEALFVKSAAMDHPTIEEQVVEEESSSDDAFYEAIGKATGISEISAVTPTILAQNWVAAHDPDFDATTTTAFTVTDVTHVDAGYEFVFTTLAMQASKLLLDKDGTTQNTRQYMVMSNFVTSSATSFEKFAGQVQQIILALPALRDRITVTTFHPEHIDKDKRAPVPIFAVEWSI